MRDSFTLSLIFLVRTLGDLYLLTYLLRFIMQWVRADFYNPLAQFVVKATNPLVVPARRIIPSAGGADLATLLILIILEAVLTWSLLFLGSLAVTASTFALLVPLRLINLTLWFYTISLFVYVLMSWLTQASYSPISRMLAELNEPLLGPVRRLLPPMGGLDLSPLLVLILIQAVRLALPLPAYLS
ncbi:MAG: YggT family protein [Gammaproteobacteria bacterium]|nr:YggT family protein [Gammaproteobacteria bacterium]MDH3506182.1 YggT family protein [Gammaproteobacteria bacterium]